MENDCLPQFRIPENEKEVAPVMMIEKSRCFNHQLWLFKFLWTNAIIDRQRFKAGVQIFQSKY